MAGNVGRLLVVMSTIAFAPILQPSAEAHPPYERIDRVVTDATGRQLQLVKRYTNGIIGNDPVSLVVRDAQGATVAETQMARDIHVACWNARDCVVFRYDGSVVIGPTDMWHVEGNGLAQTTSIWLRLIGVLLPLKDDWLAYLFATACFFTPIAMFLRIKKRSAGFSRAALLVVVSVFGAVCLLLWLYVVTILSGLDVSLLVALLAAVAFLSRRVGRIRLSRGRAREEVVGDAIQGGAQQ